MKKNELLDKFLHQFNTVVAPGAESLNKELQKKMRSAAQTTFDKLDLVTRDEFDAQRAVLSRTRKQLEEIKKQLSEDFIILYLQPTSPIRNPKHINKAFDLIKLKRKNALISIIKLNKAIYKSLRIKKEMVKPLFAESFVTNNRQAFETLYIPNGAIYIFNSSVFMKNKKIPIKSSLAYKMSENSSHDIDTLEDYTLAKKMSNKCLMYK